jgi:hypothetical protein
LTHAAADQQNSDASGTAQSAQTLSATARQGLLCAKTAPAARTAVPLTGRTQDASGHQMMSAKRVKVAHALTAKARGTAALSGLSVALTSIADAQRTQRCAMTLLAALRAPATLEREAASAPLTNYASLEKAALALTATQSWTAASTDLSATISSKNACH